MPNYVVFGRVIRALHNGDAFKPEGFAVAMRVEATTEGDESAVVNTSLTGDEAEGILEQMRKRGAIDGWREEYSGYVALGSIYPVGDEGTIRRHFPTVGVPEQALLEMTMGIADTGTPPPDAEHGPLSEYNIRSLDNARDTQGHATAVASCTFASQLVFAQALPAGSGSESSISNAIRALAEVPDLKVINLSLGFPGQKPPQSPIIAAAVRYAQGRGILVGAAAGNSGWTAGYGSPQAEADFVWGASTLDGTGPATFSSGGSNWDVESGAVPGQSVGVAHLDGGYGLADGTSFSAPLANSLVCALYGHMGMAKEDVKAYIAEHQVPYSPPRKHGLVVVVPEDLGFRADIPTPEPGPGGTVEEIDGICDEVWRLADEAQKAALAGNPWAGVEALGPTKEYMRQIKELLPKVGDGESPAPPTPPIAVDEDWANLVSRAPGLAGKQKWYSGQNANGIDIFVQRGTIIRAPFNGTVKFEQVSGGPMLMGQMTLVHEDMRTVRYRHVAVTANQLEGSGFAYTFSDGLPLPFRVRQAQPLSTVIVNDASMDMLKWPAGYPTPPDGYQHLDLSLASHPSRMDPTGGAGGDVNAYQHIWGKKGGIPHIEICPRTPGPPEGLRPNSWASPSDEPSA